MRKSFFNFEREPPIIEIWKVRKNFDRTTPLFWIGFFSILIMIIGIIFQIETLKFLAGFILFIYISFFVLLVREK